MTNQSQLQTFSVHGKDIHKLGPKHPDMTSNNRSWKTPVMLTSYLKQEMILVSFEFFNNTVNIGTNVNTPVLLTFPHSLISKYFRYSNGSIFNTRTILLFIVTYIFLITLTAVTFSIHCPHRIEPAVNVIPTD